MNDEFIEFEGGDYTPPHILDDGEQTHNKHIFNDRNGILWKLSAAEGCEMSH